MAISVNSEALGGWADVGYHLKEVADHIVELLFKDAHVDYFSQVGATPEAFQDRCQQDWNSRMKVEAY